MNLQVSPSVVTCRQIHFEMLDQCIDAPRMQTIDTNHTSNLLWQVP